MSELQNTLTHELGHLLGLEHTCRASRRSGARRRPGRAGAAVRRDQRPDDHRSDDVQLPGLRRDQEGVARAPTTSPRSAASTRRLEDPGHLRARRCDGRLQRSGGGSPVRFRSVGWVCFVTRRRRGSLLREDVGDGAEQPGYPLRHERSGVPVVRRGRRPGYVRCPKCRQAAAAAAAGPPRAAAGRSRASTRAASKRLDRARCSRSSRSAAAIIAYLRAAQVTSRPRSRLPPAHADRPSRAATERASRHRRPTEPARHRPRRPAPRRPRSRGRELERELKKQRLWSTVQITGSRVDVRSGSCSDPRWRRRSMSAAPSFKAAGLTKLRCLEQSGAVVFDRDL